jgi:hypothetical protein
MRVFAKSIGCSAVAAATRAVPPAIMFCTTEFVNSRLCFGALEEDEDSRVDEDSSMIDDQGQSIDINNLSTMNSEDPDEFVYMVAGQTCAAEYDGELSLKRGDVVAVPRATLDNWDRSQNETRWLLAKHVRLQQTGFVNAIYLQARDDTRRTDSAAQSASGKKLADKARAHSVKKIAIPLQLKPSLEHSRVVSSGESNAVHRTNTGPPAQTTSASTSPSGSVTNKSIHARAHARLGLNSPPASPLVTHRSAHDEKKKAKKEQHSGRHGNGNDNDDDDNDDNDNNGDDKKKHSSSDGKKRADPLAVGREVDRYIMNDPQLSAIDDSDGSATHVFDDEDVSPWHTIGPLSIEHSRAANAALEAVPYYQPALNRAVASAILHERGQFLLREAEPDDALASIAPQWEAFVMSFHDGDDVRHVGIEFNAKSTVWRVAVRDAPRFGTAPNPASSVDGLVVQLGSVLTSPYLRRQRADLRTRSGSSNSAFAEAEHAGSTAPSPRVNVEVIDDVDATMTFDGMHTQYGILRDDGETALPPAGMRTQFGVLRSDPESTLRQPTLISTGGTTVLHGAHEATLVMPSTEQDNDDESHSGDTDFSSAVFGTFVLRQFQEEQAREALAENQRVVSERRRAEAGLAPMRRQVVPSRRFGDGAAASQAPQRAAPAPAPNRRAPAPPPAVRVERDVLAVWKQLRPKPQNLPLLQPDVFLVARGPVSLIRRGKDPLPLRALLFNTYLMLCRSESVSKSKHYLRCAVITRLTPTIKMTHTPGTRVFGLIHPFRVFLLEARSEEAAATWASAIENAVAFAPSTPASESDSLRDTVAKAFDAVDLPSAAAREHLRLRPRNRSRCRRRWQTSAS